MCPVGMMKQKIHPNRRSILSFALVLAAMILPLAADEKEKAIEVPEDFSLSISMPSVGGSRDGVLHEDRAQGQAG